MQEAMSKMGGKILRHPANASQKYRGTHRDLGGQEPVIESLLFGPRVLAIVRGRHQSINNF